MEHDRHIGVLRACPHRVERAMRGRVTVGATAGDQQCGRTHIDRLLRHRRRQLEIDERYIARRQQALIYRAELDHAAVMRAGRAVSEVEVAAALPVIQPAVVERVEQQLALQTEQIERTRPIVSEKRPGGREVLAQHDLLRLDCSVGVAAVALGQLQEGPIKIGELLVD